MRTTRFALLTIAALAVPIAAWSADGPGQDSFQHAEHQSSSRLVEKVRDLNLPQNPANLGSEYSKFLGCFSGPNGGAMGVHFANAPSVFDGLLYVNKPEAVIYEPTDHGFRLVGVEYIVDVAAWHAQPGKKHEDPPVLEGQSFQFVDSPNRFKLPPFYELHVWLRDNPHGAFADWNTHVSCDLQ